MLDMDPAVTSSMSIPIAVCALHLPTRSMVVIIAFDAFWEVSSILSGWVRDNWDTRRDGSRRYRCRSCEGRYPWLFLVRSFMRFVLLSIPKLPFVTLDLGARGIVVVCCSLRYLIVTWIGIIVNNPANIRVVSVKVGQNS